MEEVTGFLRSLQIKMGVKSLKRAHELQRDAMTLENNLDLKLRHIHIPE